MAPTGERTARLGLGLARRGDRYGLLLFLLVLTYVLSAFTTAKGTSAFESLLFVAVLLLALRTSRVHRRTIKLIMAVTAVGTASAVALALRQATDISLAIVDIWTSLILLVTVAVILRRVLTRPTVSLQSIFGAVSAYMIIGLMFAAIYAAMSRLESAPFFSGGSPANTRTLQYFSFTTLTTLGYGDFTAGTNGGRAVAVMEALGGQIFLATLVARLVASYRAPRRGGGAPQRVNGTRRPADPGRPRNGNQRRGNGQRPRARRPPPVKWRSARRR